MNHEAINLRKAIRHQLSNGMEIVQDGKLNAYKLPSGTVIVREEESQGSDNPWLFTVVYLLRRTRATWNHRRRDSGLLRCEGYKVSRVITEVGSGINDTRKQWLSLLQDRMVRIIVVEHKDRFTRFGLRIQRPWLNTDGRDIEVV